jgi:RimJ/RimL family protein N-acetyltransferase
VRLRPLHERDIPRVVEACSDERTQYWLSLLPSPYTDTDAASYLEASRLGAASGTWLQFAVADPHSDLLLGSVGIPRMGAHGAEIGYWSHPAARGRGLMTEAVGLLTRHVFSTPDGGLGAHRLFIRAAVDNLASTRG